MITTIIAIGIGTMIITIIIGITKTVQLIKYKIQEKEDNDIYNKWIIEQYKMEEEEKKKKKKKRSWKK